VIRNAPLLMKSRGCFGPALICCPIHRSAWKRNSRKCISKKLYGPGPIGPFTPLCGPTRLRPGVHLAELQPTTEGRMMDDSMYPVDAVRPLARAMRSTAISWYDADHRLVEKLAEDMTVQEFIDAAEDQRDRTLRENARMMAAFMNHDGAGEQTTLGEILDRDDRLWRG